MTAGDRQLHAASLRLPRDAVAVARTVASSRGLVIEHSLHALLATGTAWRLELPEGLAATAEADGLHGQLASIRSVAAGGGDRWPAPRPMALGALPFDRGAAAHLVVPAMAVAAPAVGPALLTITGTDRERVAATRDRLADDPAALRELMLEEAGEAAGADAGASPDQFSLTATRDHEDFKQLVARCVEDIRGGALDKVVLVREVLAESNRPLVTGELVSRLRALYPSCAVFSVEGFVGASPELLLERSGRRVASHPLAGTIGRSGDPETDARLEQALLASAKDRSEHRVVVDAIAECLAPFCETLEIPDGPSIVELRNVSHLGTSIAALLRPDAPSALGLVARLHPTPAVAGTPRHDALEWIAKHEDLDRGPYAGPVGWVDAAGDGEWFIGIRAALVEGKRARLFAGVGIVADSDPAAELVETQLKLQAMLSAAVRP